MTIFKALAKKYKNAEILHVRTETVVCYTCPHCGYEDSIGFTPDLSVPPCAVQECYKCKKYMWLDIKKGKAKCK